MSPLRCMLQVARVSLLCLALAAPRMAISEPNAAVIGIEERDSLIEFIKAASRANEEAVSTIRMSWALEYTWEEAFKELRPDYHETAVDEGLLTSAVRVQLVRDSNRRFRCATTTTRNSGLSYESLYGYDGTVLKYFDEQRLGDRRGRVSAERQDVGELSPDRLSGYWIDGMRLSEYLDKSPIQEARHVQDAHGREVVELVTFYPGDENCCIRIHLDPKKGFCLTGMYTEQVSPPHLAIAIENTEFQEIKPGIWYPTKGSMKSYHWFENDQEPRPMKSTQVSVENLEVGVPIEDADFNIDFPHGTHVLDEIAGGTYTVGAEEHMQELLTEAQDVQEREFSDEQGSDLRELNRSQDAEPSSRPRRFIFLLAVAVVLLLLTAIVYVRTRKRA